jgi:hypothetical protein
VLQKQAVRTTLLCFINTAKSSPVGIGHLCQVCLSFTRDAARSIGYHPGPVVRHSSSGRVGTAPTIVIGRCQADQDGGQSPPYEDLTAPLPNDMTRTLAALRAHRSATSSPESRRGAVRSQGCNPWTPSVARTALVRTAQPQEARPG